MKTRMSLWQDYRNEINSNIELQKTVEFSNEKLKVLTERLYEIYPEYEDKYSIELPKIEIKTQEITSPPKFSSEKIHELLAVIQNLGNDQDNSFSAIDGLDFSSHELDDVIEAISKKRLNTERHIEVEKIDKIKVNRVKIVSLNKNKPIKNKINIAIDGPSGSGKSTVAKLIAKKYNLDYINTGLVYRAVAFNLMKNNIDLDDQKKVIASLEDGMIKLGKDEKIFLRNIDITKAVRSDIVSQGASKVASIDAVRKWSLKLQKYYANKSGVIMDGRDTTFKIMPNANLKFFLDTDARVRAQRRLEQNKILGYSTNYNLILKEIEERDERDRTRKVDPLHQTEDAILIDASKMSIDDVVSEISQEVDKLL